MITSNAPSIPAGTTMDATATPMPVPITLTGESHGMLSNGDSTPNGGSVNELHSHSSIQAKRDIGERSSPEQDLLPVIPPNQEIYCKLLLSNILAGTLIGKNGSTISAIRQQTGCNIRISNNTNAYSPERVALVSGVNEAIRDALTEVVKIGAQVSPTSPSDAAGIVGSSLSNNHQENGILLKVIIPRSAVSLLIGKGGNRVTDMRVTTGCRIHVTTKEDVSIPTNDRIVKILGGDVGSVADALLLVIRAIQSDPSVKDSHSFGHDFISNAGSNGMMASPVSHYGRAMSSSAGGVVPYNQPTAMMPHAFAMNHVTVDMYLRSFGMEPWMIDRSTEIFMQVPDSYVGVLVGRSGQHISDIKNQCNAKIEISKKGDFVEGTTDRLVTISGSIISVHSAHARLMKRVMDMQNQERERFE